MAILINDTSYIFTIGTSEPYSYDHMGITTEATRHLICSIEGIYKILWSLGVYADFLPSSKVEKGELRRYKVVFLPFPIALSDRVAQRLREFVEEGGISVSEACPGRFNEYGMANLLGFSPPLEEVFGVEEENVVMCREWGKLYRSPRPRYLGDITPPTVLNGIGLLRGLSIKGCFWLQTYKVKSATPIFSWGNKVCGVVSKFGKGRAYLIGTFFGHNPMVYEEDSVRDFIAYILSHAGIRSDKIGRLIRRRLISNDGEIHFLINTSTEPVREKMKISNFRLVYDLITQHTLELHEGVVKIEVKPLDIIGIVLEH